MESNKCLKKLQVYLMKTNTEPCFSIPVIKKKKKSQKTHAWAFQTECCYLQVFTIHYKLQQIHYKLQQINVLQIHTVEHTAY